MRPQSVVIMAAVLLQLVWAAPSRASQHQGADTLPTKGDINLPYPAEIDLEQESAGWTYRLNQNQSPLYMSTADPPGKSACNGACAKRWIPVVPQANAKPLGDWSIIVRKDGRHQWAFKGHPVYTYVKDTSEKPTGGSGTFHVMPHFR
jgi:predicted lipoprotein with Yx(FWY)xxD motif